MTERILSYVEALAEVLAAAEGLGETRSPVIETVSLLDSLGRVLAEPLRA